MNIPILSLDRVEAPIDEARGLSNPWYTHESCFITERDTIFRITGPVWHLPTMCRNLGLFILSI